MTNSKFNQNITASVIERFSSEMYKRRKKLGYTLKVLSEKSNVSDMQLHNMERGKIKNISLITLFQISAALNYYEWISGVVNPQELLCSIKAVGSRLILIDIDKPTSGKSLMEFKHDEY